MSKVNRILLLLSVAYCANVYASGQIGPNTNNGMNNHNRGPFFNPPGGTPQMQNQSNQNQPNHNAHNHHNNHAHGPHTFASKGYVWADERHLAEIFQSEEVFIDAYKFLVEEWHQPFNHQQANTLLEKLSRALLSIEQFVEKKLPGDSLIKAHFTKRLPDYKKMYSSLHEALLHPEDVGAIVRHTQSVLSQ